MSTVVVLAVQRIPKLTDNSLIFYLNLKFNCPIFIFYLFIYLFFWGGGGEPGVFGEEAAPSLTGSHIIH